MSRYWFIAAILLIGLPAAAQFELGLRGGVNFLDMDVDEFASTQKFDELTAEDRKIGFHAGLYSQIEIGSLFLQPEVLYTRLSQDMEASGDGESEEISMYLQRLDMPLLLGTEIGPLRLMAGPVYSIIFQANSGPFEQNWEDGTLGLQMGLGVRINKVILDIRYERAFQESARGLIHENTNYEADFRAHQIMASMGIALF